VGRAAGADVSHPVHAAVEVDYLAVQRPKICVGWSRHWAVVWLWFLS
jgi:hypothetical protein